MLSPTVKADSPFQLLARISLFIYPLIAHIGILMDAVMWSACYLVITVYFNSLNLFSQHKIIGVGFSALMCALLYVLVSAEMYTAMMFLPPVLIPAWLAVVFFTSLQTEHALISRMAERIEGKPLDEMHLRYTRQLTALWGAVFVLMVCEAIGLAIWVPYELWSWWVHIGNYIVIAILFLGEMLLRNQLIGHKVQFVAMFRALLQRNWYK